MIPISYNPHQELAQEEARRKLQKLISHLADLNEDKKVLGPGRVDTDELVLLLLKALLQIRTLTERA